MMFSEWNLVLRNMKFDEKLPVTNCTRKLSVQKGDFLPILSTLYSTKILVYHFSLTFFSSVYFDIRPIVKISILVIHNYS